jgi:hypothetical protein
MERLVIMKNTKIFCLAILISPLPFVFSSCGNEDRFEHNVSISGDGSGHAYDVIDVNLDDVTMEDCVDMLKSKKIDVKYMNGKVHASQEAIPFTLQAKKIELFDLLTLMCVHFDLKISCSYDSKGILTIEIYQN